MKIAFYMPFKPMGHKNPSGDLIIGTELYLFLGRNGAKVQLISKFRCRWIYLKPYLWPMLVIELFRVITQCRKIRPELWVSYHSYYKAPDILGPVCCRLQNIPYVIFQGIYSTKRRKKVKTKMGFYLNRWALNRADCVFTNKQPDEKNLKRLLPSDHVVYVPPGIHPGEFQFSEHSRKRLRAEWQVGGRVVVITAAMFRPGVKTKGIIKVIDSCKVLKKKGREILLVIVGDGTNRQMLEEIAVQSLGGDVKFLGKVARNEMQNCFSAADIFAFPGIEESLGMVFLEAQSCTLPVVAYKDWGANEVVVDGQTGLLSAAAKGELFTSNLERLINDADMRGKIGEKAAAHVRKNHNIEKNYAIVWQRLQQISRRG